MASLDGGLKNNPLLPPFPSTRTRLANNNWGSRSSSRRRASDLGAASYVPSTSPILPNHCILWVITMPTAQLGRQAHTGRVRSWDLVQSLPFQRLISPASTLQKQQRRVTERCAGRASGSTPPILSTT